MPNGALAGPSTQRARPGEPQPTAPAPPSDTVPSKRDLTSWWRQFKRGNAKREEEKGESTFVSKEKTVDDPPRGRNPLRMQRVHASSMSQAEKPRGIFGVDLQDSIKYANVAISLFNEQGESYIYGYVPIVVAKCGVFLKEKAVDVEGIFRLSGSEKRIKELREAFNSPDRYGKGLDWTGYTVHDAANILRRYFNQLPEPIIPLEFYESFRGPLRHHQAQAVGPMDGQGQTIGEFDGDAAIKIYQKLITELPPLNRQLLLYILDLLAVFASKSDLNKMTTPNLAAIFQPGILSHPLHDMSPPDYRLSQDVLIFLIENQDNFLIGMQGTAADAETVKEVESGPPTPSGRTPTTPSRSKTTIGRSASNSSAGAESIRKQGLVRRNVSVSSRKSKTSVAVPSPVTPVYQTSSSIGVHRSNTLPTKKSPIVPSRRFTRDKPASQSPGAHETRAAAVVPAAVAQVQTATGEQAVQSKPLVSPSQIISPPSSEDITPIAAAPSVSSAVGLLPQHAETPHRSRAEAADTPTGGFRSFSNMFGSSPSDTEGREKRKPNKLQKKRAPSTNPSAASSTNSLTGSHPGPPSPLPQMAIPTTPAKDQAPISPIAEFSPPKPQPNNNLQPSMSPSASTRSRSTTTDFSEAEHRDEAHMAEQAERENKKLVWRTPGKHDKRATPATSESNYGSNAGAEQSMSSFGSTHRARKSLTLEPNETPTPAGHDGGSKDGDKKGPIEWFRGKLAERKEREEAKQRAKSPPNTKLDMSHISERHNRSTSNLALSPISQSGIPARGKSTEIPRSWQTPTNTSSQDVTPTQTPGNGGISHMRMTSAPVATPRTIPLAATAAAAASSAHSRTVSVPLSAMAGGPATSSYVAYHPQLGSAAAAVAATNDGTARNASVPSSHPPAHFGPVAAAVAATGDATARNASVPATSSSTHYPAQLRIGPAAAAMAATDDATARNALVAAPWSCSQPPPQLGPAAAAVAATNDATARNASVPVVGSGGASGDAVAAAAAAGAVQQDQQQPDGQPLQHQEEQCPPVPELAGVTRAEAASPQSPASESHSPSKARPTSQGQTIRSMLDV